MRPTNLARLGLLAALAMVIVACGGGGEGGATTQPGPTQPAGAPTTTASATTTTGGGSPGDLPGPGAGDSWFEVDGERFEVAHLVRCDVVPSFGRPPNEDDFAVGAFTLDGREQLELEYFNPHVRITGQPPIGQLEVTQLQPSAGKNFWVFLDEDTEFSFGGGRLRGGPVVVEMSVTGQGNVEGQFSFDIEVLSAKHPDCPAE